MNSYKFVQGPVPAPRSTVLPQEWEAELSQKLPKFFHSIWKLSLISKAVSAGRWPKLELLWSSRQATNFLFSHSINFNKFFESNTDMA